jgi:polar amino acid transport system substrate-binding protein
MGVSHAGKARSIAAVAGIVAATALILAGCSSTPGAKSSSSTSAAKGVNAKAAAFLPADVRTSGVLTVGIAAPNPPFTQVDKSDSSKFSGVEYNMVEGIAKSLGLKAKFTNQDWPGLMPAVSSGRYDMILSTIGDFPARRASITFVDYGSTGMALLVRAADKGKYTKDADMCGKSIGFQTGSNEGVVLTKASTDLCGSNPIKIKAFQNGALAFPAVTSGQIDAVAEDSPQAYWYDATQGTTYAAVLDDLISPNPYGIGINKNQPGLVKAVQAALQGLIDDGQYQKWFDEGNVGKITIKKATINGEGFTP